MTQLPSDGSPTPNVDEALQREIDEALAGQSIEKMMDESAPTEAAAKGDAAPEGDDADIPSEVKRGRIAAIRGDEVFVEIGGTARRERVEFSQQVECLPRIGSIMDFVVTRYDESEGIYFLSREGAVGRQTWDQITKGSAVEARVVGSNKGGLELEMVGNIRAFMPLSQIDLGRVDDPDSWVGQKVQAIVQDLDRKSNRVVLSRRQFIEKTRDQQRGKTMSELEVNQIREGTVTSVMEYGAFVDLGGVDGLVHVSDISYTRVETPGDVLKVGDKVTVKVLKIYEAKRKISLVINQIEPDPWRLAS